MGTLLEGHPLKPFRGSAYPPATQTVLVFHRSPLTTHQLRFFCYISYSHDDGSNHQLCGNLRCPLRKWRIGAFAFAAFETRRFDGSIRVIVATRLETLGQAGGESTRRDARGPHCLI